MRSPSRRDFLRDAAALSAALAGVASVSADDKPAKARGKADDYLNVAVVGVRSRGLNHVDGFALDLNPKDPKKKPRDIGTRVTHICDCDTGVIRAAMAGVKARQGEEPKFVQDFRRLAEDKSIDVIAIATPNHWHSLMAVWTMQNGKHVYVEKPVSHNVWEGRQVVEAARKYGKICQAGMQIRSSKGIRDAIAYLHSGALGKVRVARGLCYKYRGSIGKTKGPHEPPKTCDYDLWCGPAPKAPLMRARLHYDWHWVWDTGNGDLGNQGIHQMDVARWGLGKQELPKTAFSVGGRFGYLDDGETANTQLCVFDYGDAELIFEVRGLKTDPYKGAGVGNVFHCADGYLVVPGYEKAIAFSPKGEKIKEFGGGGDHYANFVRAVKANDPKLLHADILEGHLSSALCHLGNVSYRLGEVRDGEDVKKACDDKVTAETLGRTLEHLKANKVEPKFRVGRKLKLDPIKEVLVGDKEATPLLTREYRKGFAVPDKL